MITNSIDLSKNSFLHPVHAYRVYFPTQSQPGNNEYIVNMRRFHVIFTHKQLCTKAEKSTDQM